MEEKNNALTIQNHSEIKSDVITTLVDYLHTIISSDLKNNTRNVAMINAVSGLADTIEKFLY